MPPSESVRLQAASALAAARGNKMQPWHDGYLRSGPAIEYD